MASDNRIPALAKLAIPSLLLCVNVPTFGQAEGGTHIPAQIDTPVNYPGVREPGQVVSTWFYVLSHPGATYIAIHFVNFGLGPGDYLVVSDGTGQQQYLLKGRGKMGAGTFWAQHVKGDTAVLELITTGTKGGRGFQIDEYVAGHVNMSFSDWLESVCGADDRQNAVCYETSHPTEYDRGRAVVRLLTNGSAFCTGSLVSPYNHVLTNNHCIGTASKALNTDYEFMAEAPNCDDPNCRNCYPGVVFSGGILIRTSGALDYCLVQLNSGDPAGTFGFLEVDNRPPIIGEQIYIPQHPDGRAKEFAIFSTHPSDTGGVCRIFSITEPPCVGGPHNDIGYFAESEPGASGSPVLATSSHKLIGLHHCGGCPNRAVPISLIYPEIENDLLGFGSPGRIAPGAVAVSANSFTAGQEPDNAIDGDIHTRWTSLSSGSPHWLQLDLGLWAFVTGFKVWHAGAAGDPTSLNTRAFLIESAPEADGPWTTEFVGSNPAQENVNTFEYAGPQQLRHIRLYVTDPGDTGYARIPEFEVIAEETMIEALPGGENVAPLAATAQASSVFGPEWGPTKAIDGVVSLESKWVSADVSPPHTLTLDLGAVYSVGGFVLRQPSDAGEASYFNATDFSFQSARSLSGPWFTEARFFTSGDADFAARKFISPKDLRYVRLHIADPGIDSYARVPEFEVRTAEPPPPVRPTPGTLIFQDGRRFPDDSEYTSTRDAHILQEHPLYNTGGSSVLEATRYTGADSTHDRSIVVKFTALDTSLEAGKVLQQASLTLNYFDSRNDPGGVVKTLYVHKLLHDWGEGTKTAVNGEWAGAGEVCWTKPFGATGGDNPNWNGTLDAQYADPVALASVALGGSEDHGPASFDVTEAVRDHLASPTQNFGFVIREEEGSESAQDGTRQFRSREYALIGNRPSLTLTFVAPAAGDFDLDGDVDLDDYDTYFAPCYMGPGSQVTQECQKCDLDDDHDVDLLDFATFQYSFTDE